MEKAKVLFVAQEITPYLPESHMSKIARYLPQGIQEKGKEIRTFMPRYGKINERRNQLHEVIRLSGMNLIIDDTDHPLIIKVASIQAARMQVYFIDNEEFFQRKFVLTDKEDKYFADNDERAIFFARGVLETVKKLRWSPDIIHCHGWITSLIAPYIKDLYKDNPLFNDAKIVYSLYDEDLTAPLDGNFYKKLTDEGFNGKEVEGLKDSPSYANLSKLAIDKSDAVVMGSDNLNPELQSYIKDQKKNVLEYSEGEDYVDAYDAFYESILAK
ncbi:MAG: glycogen/starch synthase [Salinivirgaceae bacterium]|jgi:starch synthase|nr:glycogen/starch synthase [Salinivirgaceae bacterium]